MAFAIIPVEVESDPDQGWSGQFAIGFAGETGNSKEQNVNLSWLARHRHQSRIALALGDTNYGKQNEVKSDDDATTHLRWILLDRIQPGLDTEAFAQWQYDDFKDLKNRGLLGGGVRWRVNQLQPTAQADIKSSTLNTTFGAGFFYEREERESLSDSEEGLRGNFYSQFVWKIKQHETQWDLYGIMYIQPMIGETDNLRAITTIGASFPMLASLSFSIEINIDYDGEPFGDRKKTDTDYVTKMVYRL